MYKQHVPCSQSQSIKQDSHKITHGQGAEACEASLEAGSESSGAPCKSLAIFVAHGGGGAAAGTATGLLRASDFVSSFGVVAADIETGSLDTTASFFS